ncbi:MAG: MFS transporter [Bacteroidetes bacterium]|nr:MAG: MFS transporter [Bacteroidota bacterium]
MSEIQSKLVNRNFTYNAIEGALWVAGASLVSPITVLPALISRLGGGNLEVGVMGVIIYVGLFLPQIFAARYGQTLEWKKPWVVGFGLAQRFAILFIGTAIFFFGNNSPLAALWLFLFFFAINQTILGITTPIWFDFVVKLTPLKKRGRLSGIRNSLAGGLSVLGSLLLTWLLTSFSFPLNYSLVFFCTFVLQLTAIAFQMRIVEEHPSAVHPLHSLKDYIKHLREIVTGNSGFKTFLFASVFLILATMPGPFFTVYAIKQFGADETMIGKFTIITVIGQIIGALANGFLADHAGNKIALISASFSVLCATCFALLAPSLAWFSVVFFCVGIFIGSELMIRYNLAIEYGPHNQRATYIGLMNTLLAPIYLSAFLGGALSDLFGYTTLFVTGIFFSLIGIGLLIMKVEEPRKQPTI